MKPKILVIYHKADFDGIFCREIAKRYFEKQGYDTEYLGWDYGDPVPVVAPETKIYMLDISVDGLMDHPGLNWIDHHKSAIDKFSSKISGYRIDGVAACRLAWHYFFGAVNWTKASIPTKLDFVDRLVPEPLSVRLAGEYDIWDKRDPRAELFQHGLRSRELSENLWDLLLTPELPVENDKEDVGVIAVNALLEAGEAIQYAKNAENKSIITAYGFTRNWEGLTFLCCNHARFNSLLFTEGVNPEHDALLGFNFDGQQWRISLYHAPGKEFHDLSTIAVKYGGGGHRGACGFRRELLPFTL